MDKKSEQTLFNQNNYDWLTILLHWSVALLVFGLFILGFWMVDLDYYHGWYHPAPELHKSIGICLFGLMIFRVIWRVKQGKPTPLDSHNVIEKRLASLVHHLIYFCIFITLISGYLIATADGRGIEVFELFEIPAFGELFEKQADKAGLIHQYVAYALILIVFLHGLAALKHHFIDKDKTLLRMLKKN
jgi:cytochrome b561